jgi:hypothetical protein
LARILEVIRDGTTLLHFTRGPTVPALQRRQLDELDSRLDEGIDLEGEHIDTPDRQQRARFVIGQLLRALARDDEATARGLCVWLVQRVPELVAIRVSTRGGVLDVELDYVDEGASDE